MNQIIAINLVTGVNNLPATLIINNGLYQYDESITGRRFYMTEMGFKATRLLMVEGSI